MKVLIKKVNPRTEYQGVISDFWVNVQLKTGKLVQLFDCEPFDLRDYENVKIECLVLAFMAKDISNNHIEELAHPHLEGNIIRDYEIEKKWVDIHNSLNDHRRYWSAVETLDGIFLIDPGDLKLITIKEKNRISFTVGRLDLLAWLPIEK